MNAPRGRRLHVELVPFEDAAGTVQSERLPQPFAVPCPESITVSELAGVIGDKFRRLFPNLPELRIKQLENGHGELLDGADTVGVSFDVRMDGVPKENYTVRVVRDPAMMRPDFTPVARYASVVPESSARPQKRPYNSLLGSVLEHNTLAGSKRPRYDGLSRSHDQPVRSVERDVEILGDGPLTIVDSQPSPGRTSGAARLLYYLPTAQALQSTEETSPKSESPEQDIHSVPASGAGTPREDATVHRAMLPPSGLVTPSEKRAAHVKEGRSHKATQYGAKALSGKRKARESNGADIFDLDDIETSQEVVTGPRKSTPREAPASKRKRINSEQATEQDGQSSRSVSAPDRIGTTDAEGVDEENGANGGIEDDECQAEKVDAQQDLSDAETQSISVEEGDGLVARPSKERSKSGTSSRQGSTAIEKQILSRSVSKSKSSPIPGINGSKNRGSKECAFCGKLFTVGGKARRHERENCPVVKLQRSLVPDEEIAPESGDEGPASTMKAISATKSAKSTTAVSVRKTSTPEVPRRESVTGRTATPEVHQETEVGSELRRAMEKRWASTNKKSETTRPKSILERLVSKKADTTSSSVNEELGNKNSDITTLSGVNKKLANKKADTTPSTVNEKLANSRAKSSTKSPNANKVLAESLERERNELGIEAPTTASKGKFLTPIIPSSTGRRSILRQSTTGSDRDTPSRAMMPPKSAMRVPSISPEAKRRSVSFLDVQKDSEDKPMSDAEKVKAVTKPAPTGAKKTPPATKLSSRASWLENLRASLQKTPGSGVENPDPKKAELPATTSHEGVDDPITNGVKTTKASKERSTSTENASLSLPNGEPKSRTTSRSPAKEVDPSVSAEESETSSGEDDNDENNGSRSVRSVEADMKKHANEKSTGKAQADSGISSIAGQQAQDDTSSSATTSSSEDDLPLPPLPPSRSPPRSKASVLAKRTSPSSSSTSSSDGANAQLRLETLQSIDGRSSPSPKKATVAPKKPSKTHIPLSSLKSESTKPRLQASSKSKLPEYKNPLKRAGPNLLPSPIINGPKASIGKANNGDSDSSTSSSDEDSSSSDDDDDEASAAKKAKLLAIAAGHTKRTPMKPSASTPSSQKHHKSPGTSQSQSQSQNLFMTQTQSQGPGGMAGTASSSQASKAARGLKGLIKSMFSYDPSFADPSELESVHGDEILGAEDELLF